MYGHVATAVFAGALAAAIAAPAMGQTALNPGKKDVPEEPKGVVTLSLIDWNLPTTADFDAWDFRGLACRSIVHIGRISLNVTMPSGLQT